MQQTAKHTYSFKFNKNDLKDYENKVDAKKQRGLVHYNKKGISDFMILIDEEDEVKFEKQRELLKKYLGIGGEGDGSEISLNTLSKAGEISVSEIKKYRDYILMLPEGIKGKWYIELQKHVPYHSQRDNNQTQRIADGMCNLTTLAMNFEYLGITSPDPNMQFEDYLEKMRKEKEYNQRTNPESWKELAKDLGIKSKKIGLWTNKKQIIIDLLQPHINLGRSISLSVFPACKGHIVRIQNIVPEGLIIDDPFGLVNNFKQRNECGSGYIGTSNAQNEKNGSIKGKNNLWTWNDINDTILKYAIIFYK
jgi:hypothetical protein